MEKTMSPEENKFSIPPQGVAEVYHQRTKYHEQEMFRYQKKLDPTEQPSPYKEYHTEKKIDLVSHLPFQNNLFTGQPITPSLEGEEEAPLGRKALSRLLYFTNGVTGILKYPNGQSLALRASPTAGGMYPTEIYLAIRRSPTLASGIYNFQVKDHSLVLVWEGDYWAELERYCMGHDAVAQSDALMIFTAVYQRSAWRYAERAYRRILLDTGHILGNLMAYASEEDLIAYPIGGFFDTALNSLLFFDPSTEGVLAVTALLTSDQAASFTLQSRSARSSPASTGGVTDSEMLQLQLHRASSIREGKEREDPVFPPHSEPDSFFDTLSDDTKQKKETTFPSAVLTWPEGMAQTILTRRSTRGYTGEAFLQEELAAVLGYGYQTTLSHPHSFFNPSLLSTYLVVQKVIGLPAGIYMYDPSHNSAYLLRAGHFNKQTTHFCLGQELATNATALVIHMAHLQTSLDQYGDRAYRYLHLDAGHIGERINLASVRMGLGVSGIGGFYDDEVNTLLGLSLNWIVVYITTLGRH
jgi:SagB-type dehydrogenase family enzyme